MLAARALVAQLQLKVVDPLLRQLAFETLLRLQRTINPKDCGPGQEDAQYGGDELQGGSPQLGATAAPAERASGIKRVLGPALRSLQLQRQNVCGFSITTSAVPAGR
ncbi:MAG: hypothetical protein F4W99_12035 [Chloroflexi bacterium]|nr:hypothetical protein [Chloroflexota bacterium]